LTEQLHNLRNHYLGKLSRFNTKLAEENLSRKERSDLEDKKCSCEVSINVIRKNCIKAVGTGSFVKSIINDYLNGLYKNDEREFDNTWNLYGFNDGVYDLKESSFRPYKSEDYITMTNGYDYEKVLQVSDEDYRTIENLIEQIHHDKDNRRCYESIIATSLEGKTLEKFIVFNGKGGNGKGLLNELLIATHGSYATTLNSSVLCIPLMSIGPNPDIASLNKKRFVVSSEAPSGSKFNNTVVKVLSGGGEVNARLCHSNDTRVKLQCTLVIECNTKPDFREDIDDAEIRRIIDLNFPCKFTDNPKQVRPDNNIYPANPYYKTIEFKEKYKYAMMKYLLNIYQETKGELYIPESIRQRSLEYITYSNWALKWFKENYEKIENPTIRDFVKIMNIFARLKQSDEYSSLTRNDKRKFNKNYLITLFKDSSLLGEHYIEKYRPRIGNGERIEASNVIFGFRRRKEYDNVSDDE
jgi:phage/plasmid-associated DNA primase